MEIPQTPVRPNGEKYPPMLQQYLEYKAQYPDCLLFFQVGDFYELFFEDAVTVARTINLTLTSRDKNSPDPIPMCGVPISVADTYAERLVAQGFSVALVKQGELIGKGMVPRALDRIMTPGVRISGAAENYGAPGMVLVVFGNSSRDMAISFTDVQSGKIFVREGITIEQVAGEVARTAPNEVIVPKMLEGKAVDRRTGWIRILEQQLGVRSIKFRTPLESNRHAVQGVRGYHTLSPTGKRAVQFLLSYIDEVTVTSTIAIQSIESCTYETVLSLDATTRKNLELVQNSKDGSLRGTLFEYLNCTCAPGGARLLRHWILNPSTSLKEITERQKYVEVFLKERMLSGTLRKKLEGLSDVERIAARIDLGIVTPRELGALRDLLQQIPAINNAIPDAASELSLTVDVHNICKDLSRALVDLPPLSAADGGILREGFNSDLDRLIEISTKGKEWILDLEVKEREATGISSLKIRFNNVFGYFIEVTQTHLAKVPERYVRKQTTANSERYITEELKKFEEEVLGASDKRIILERKLFEVLRSDLKPATTLLREIGEKISTLDLLLAFAEKAYTENLSKPIVDESTELLIKNGKHPQLSQLLRHEFIPNSLDLSSTPYAIITGPNMGGKSTYLRQAALLVILSQIGAYVPAEYAKVGIVDAIFARLGASDDIIEGESTFMVEMREASYILQNATERSLLLIDEIGRGTATADGLALARAILEWIVVQSKSRTLFATHFHELTELQSLYPSLQNLSVGSVEKDGHVIFTHQIQQGPASKSYGIEVARLAGLPKGVLDRAREILKSQPGIKKQSSEQLSIFEAQQPIQEPVDTAKPLRAYIEKINNIDVNSLTPLEALNVLSNLHEEQKKLQD